MNGVTPGPLDPPQGPAEPTVALPPLTPGHTIPAGTRLHDYRIDRVLGEGGFGIVYLATDVVLERQVAIKEYLPSSMAARAGQSLTVLVKSPVHEETFLIGLRSFVNEAKLLARFDHPALVKVHQFWEQNGTAYMAMPYYQGPTLKAALARLGRPPTEREVRAWLMPLMDALEVMHKEHCYHRDIAPDNILLTDHGPLLLDFGAARRVIGDLTHALTAMLKPGFAPIEQYGEMPGISQGPWTDIFALASVLYAAISAGRTVPAVERLLNDEMRPLSVVAAGRCGNAFLAAIDAALAVHPRNRPQSIAEFRALLTADDTQALELSELRAMGLPDDDATVLLPDIDPTRRAAEPQRPAPSPPPPRPPPSLPPSLPPSPPPTASPSPARPPTSEQPVVNPGAVPPHLPQPALPHAAALPRRAIALGAAGLAALAAAAWGGYHWLSTPEVPRQPAAPAASTVPAPPPPARLASGPDIPASAAPTPSTPPPAAAPVPAVPPPPAPAQARPRPPVPATVATTPAKGEKCSDILQKASLEPLTASEASYLKKECR